MNSEFFNYLLEHYSLYVLLVMGAMTILISLILELIKIPLKKLTAKIKDETLRKLANKSIILLAFGLSAGIWFTMQAVVPKYFDADLVNIIITGTLPICLYALGDGVLSNGGAKNIINTLNEVAKDKKITKEEAKKLANTLNENIEPTNNLKDAASELEKLLK